MSLFRRNWIYSTLLLLSSCLSMSKEEQAMNVLELPSVAKTAEMSMKSGFFEEGAWPEKQWWKVFDEEKLSALIDEALEKNPSIMAIQRRVELAKQNAKVVRSKLFPLLFFDYSQSWEYLSYNGLDRAFNNKIPINANLLDLSLSFTYEFDFWSKNRNLFRAALGITKADEAESAQVTLITTTAVAQAYFALKTNLHKRSLLNELTEVKKNIYDLQMLMKDKALFSRLVPLRGEEDLQDTQKQLVEIEKEVQVDKHLLNILAGRGPDAELDIEERLFPLPRYITLPSTLSLDLLARRPDLMAQIWKVESLAHEVGAAKADFFPNINLTGFAGLETVYLSKIFTSRSKTWGLEPALNLPIFTAGSIRANIRAKKAAFDEAVFQYNEKILESTKEVADLIVLAQAVYEKKYLQENIITEAKELYDLVLLRNQKGLDSMLAVFATRLRLLERELEDVDLLYNQYLASIKLIKSLGGGYISEYLPIKAEGAAVDAMQ